MPSQVSSILWGTNFENVLNRGYPLQTVITDREPRSGTDYVQGISGLEDAWVTGFDYTLDVEARFLPVTPNFYGAAAVNPLKSQVSGALGVQGFLDWASAKNTFRFVPDYTVPSFYVDGCYLMDPKTRGRGISPRLDFTQKLKFRNPTMDFLQALRGLMFDYAPGTDIAPV